MRVAMPLEQCWHEVPGGTARSSVDLAAALVATGEVDVVGVSALHRRDPDPAWRPTVPVRSLPLPRIALYEAWQRVRWPPVELATGPVDVCHAMGGAVAASRAPLVVTVHDLAFVHHPDKFTPHGRRFFDRGLRLIQQRAAQVQVPSAHTAADCEAAGLDPSRIHIVPWGVSVTEPDPAAVEAVRRRFGLPEEYFVFVGTHEPRKNLPGLLAAWRRVRRPGVGLAVVGPGGWGGAPEGVAEGSRDLEDVTMIGFVDTRTRDALYAGALASVYPSLFEGFGLPVLESMALGCPAITSAGTATEELVAGGAGVAVDPLDIDALASAMAEVLADEGHRSRLAVAGRARAADYTWEDSARLALAGYRSVVG